MSKESIDDDLANPALQELEASLRGLSAVGNVNRDELLFEAGRRSADGRSDSRSGFWKGVSSVLALMLVGQSFLFWSSDDRQIASECLKKASVSCGCFNAGAGTGEESRLVVASGCCGRPDTGSRDDFGCLGYCRRVRFSHRRRLVVILRLL